MRYNTLIKHRMTATYNPWEERLDEDNGLLYRNYDVEGASRDIKCTIFVSMVGNIQLLADEELQGFAIIRSMRDTLGNLMMDDQWYTVQRAQPVLDAAGARTSYRHNLAAMTGEEFSRAINPTPDFPTLDMPVFG